MIAIYCLILAFNGLSTTFTAVYQGTQQCLLRGGWVDHREGAGLPSGGSVALARFRCDRHGSRLCAGSAASALWQGICLRRVTQIELRLDRAVIITLVRNAIPFFAFWVLGSLYYRLDTILLSKLTGAAVLGWYGAAYRLFDTLVFLPNIVASASSSRSCRSSRPSPPRFAPGHGQGTRHHPDRGHAYQRWAFHTGRAHHQSSSIAGRSSRMPSPPYSGWRWACCSFMSTRSWA